MAGSIEYGDTSEVQQLKLCINCKYREGYQTCRAPENQIPGTLSLVTGRSALRFRFAEDARYDQDGCGPLGSWFVQLWSFSDNETAGRYTTQSDKKSKGTKLDEL